MNTTEYFAEKEMMDAHENSKKDTCVASSSTLENDAIVYANTAQSFVVPQFGLL